MERPKSYNSTSVLGQIYDEVETFQMENISMTGEDFMFKHELIY